MEKHFYLQNMDSGNGEYAIWQPVKMFDLHGKLCARCLLVATEQFPVVSQENAPYTASFTWKTIETQFVLVA